MTHSEDRAGNPNWTSWTPARREVANLKGPEGRRYDLMLARPMGTAPAEGWSCLFVLDGERFFDAFAGAADALSPRREKTGVGPIAIAAIVYRGEDGSQRGRDFTSTPNPERGAEIPHGGADAFRRFLLDDVLPTVSERLPLDPDRLSLFGHSLAGLFVLETLERRPDAFARWISISPSLWWRTPDARIGGEHLLVGVGEDELAREMAARVSSWVHDDDSRPMARFILARGADHGSAPFALAPDILRHASGGR